MLIAIAILCALIEAVYTAFEVAIGGVSRARLRSLAEEKGDEKVDEEYSKRAGYALQVIDNGPRLSLLFITVTSLSLWTATSLLTWQAMQQHWPLWILPLALIGVLFVAEVLPVLLAAPRAEVLALRGARLLEVSMKVLSPLLWIIGGVGHGVARIFGAGDSATPQVTEEELRSALATAEAEGAIHGSERAFLEGAMDFRNKIVREVMTPRREIVALASDATLGELLRMAMAEGHSRLPVFQERLDKIIGVATTKDLLPYLRDGADLVIGQPQTRNSKLETVTVTDIVRPAFFVPENKRIAATLDELRSQRLLMAIVVDEEGATVGLVTLEDLLEEIVGDIQDEYDAEEPRLAVLTDTPTSAVVCDGDVSVRDLEKFWEQSFGSPATLRDDEGDEADDSHSVAGLALRLFDGVPQQGDRILAGEVVESESEDALSLALEILVMDGPRIDAMKFELSPMEPNREQK